MTDRRKSFDSYQLRVASLMTQLLLHRGEATFDVPTLLAAEHRPDGYSPQSVSLIAPMMRCRGLIRETAIARSQKDSNNGGLMRGWALACSDEAAREFVSHAAEQLAPKPPQLPAEAIDTAEMVIVARINRAGRQPLDGQMSFPFGADA